MSIATQKQQDFVARLMDERDVTGTAYEGWVPDWSNSTPKAASSVIDYLKTLPLKKTRTLLSDSNGQGRADTSVDLEDGVYWVDDVFVKVVTSPTTGNQYAKRWNAADEEWEYAGRQPLARLSAGDKVTAEQAKVFGLLYGQCVFCSRTLTDERSIAVGYGETCASHNGLPWGEETLPAPVVEQPTYPLSSNSHGCVPGKGCKCPPSYRRCSLYTRYPEYSKDPVA